MIGIPVVRPVTIIGEVKSGEVMLVNNPLLNDYLYERLSVGGAGNSVIDIYGDECGGT